MRNVLAVLLAIIAGVTATLGLVAWKLDEVVHQPEPVQEILGSGEAADELKSAVPDALGGTADGATGVEAIDEAMSEAISDAADELTTNPNFDEAWSQSLELTRSTWVEDITTLRGRLEAGEQIAENSTAAQLELRLDPIGRMVVSEYLPGDIEVDAEIAINTAIPPVSMLTAEQVVMAEELITVWPVILVIAGIVLLMALLVASSGNRWIVWLVTGLVGAIGGAAVKFGFSQVQDQVLEGAEGSAELTLLQPFLRAIQNWADPQLIVLMVAAAGVALLGILGGFITSHRSRSRSYDR